MAGREDQGDRRQGKRGGSEIDLLPGRTDEAAQHGLGEVDEVQGELIADPLGLEGILQARAELPALFLETGDEDLVSLLHRSPVERLTSPGGVRVC